MKKPTAFWLLIFILSIFAPTVSAQSPPDARFGVVESYVNPAEASALGAGYTRIVLRWDIIQPAGRDDWKPANVPDPLIETDLAAGREVVAVLMGTPNWASLGANDARAVPDMEAWGNFITRVAQQYQGRINTWVIWNEPNIPTDAPNSTWLGSPDDYIRLQKVAYDNIKAVNPAMRVMLGGLSDTPEKQLSYLTQLLEILNSDPTAAAKNFYFDGVLFHLYDSPRQLFDTLNQAHALLDSFGAGKKAIWVNESNALPTDDPIDPPKNESLVEVSLQAQANFVIQAAALSIAGGAQRFEIYKLQNTAENPPDGLLRSDGSRRPAFDAYRVVTKYFAGYSNYEWLHENHIYVITLNRGDKTTTVLWNDSSAEQTFALNAIAPNGILVDTAGSETPVSAVNGVYTLRLPAADCAAPPCIIGGAPRLLIEVGSPEARASLLPLATHTPTATPIPTETATVTPSPTLTPTPTVTPTPQSAIALVASPAPTRITENTSPQITAMPTPTYVSTLPDFRTIFTPARILFLIVLGSVLFTLIFFLQYRAWHNWRR